MVLSDQRKHQLHWPTELHTCKKSKSHGQQSRIWSKYTEARCYTTNQAKSEPNATKSRQSVTQQSQLTNSSGHTVSEGKKKNYPKNGQRKITRRPSRRHGIGPKRSVRSQQPKRKQPELWTRNGTEIWKLARTHKMKKSASTFFKRKIAAKTK